MVKARIRYWCFSFIIFVSLILLFATIVRIFIEPNPGGGYVVFGIVIPISEQVYNLLFFLYFINLINENYVIDILTPNLIYWYEWAFLVISFLFGIVLSIAGIVRTKINSANLQNIKAKKFILIPIMLIYLPALLLFAPTYIIAPVAALVILISYLFVLNADVIYRASKRKKSQQFHIEVNNIVKDISSNIDRINDFIQTQKSTLSKINNNNIKNKALTDEQIKEKAFLFVSKIGDEYVFPNKSKRYSDFLLNKVFKPSVTLSKNQVNILEYWLWKALKIRWNEIHGTTKKISYNNHLNRVYNNNIDLHNKDELFKM